jgi:hypothetical protein
MAHTRTNFTSNPITIPLPCITSGAQHLDYANSFFVDAPAEQDHHQVIFCPDGEQVIPMGINGYFQGIGAGTPVRCHGTVGGRHIIEVERLNRPTTLMLLSAVKHEDRWWEWGWKMLRGWIITRVLKIPVMHSRNMV